MAVHRWSFLAAVLLLASLDLWCSSSSPPCSKSCTCQRAPLLNCSSSGLSSVPQLILDSITELDLSHNFLSSVTFHQPHPNLTNLWLGNNSIPHLSLCIERTVKGRHLRLRSETGSGSRCLVWAPTLQLLSAERNQLEQLPEGLDAVESLQVLQLSFNRISSLELGILGNLHQLRELHLQHNLITHLHPQMFQNLDQLKVLDLSFNMLTNMQQLTYLTLGNIGADVRLGGNRWRCDCNMRSLRRQMAYGSTRGLQAGNIVCAFPSTVSGKDLLQLDEEDLKCLGTENNLNLHQDVTVYSGAEILLSCSAQESEWWTHSGQASVNQHEARLLISDFSEGDTGLYVCVSGEDQVLSVFKLQISKTGGIRKARSLPRVHSQKSLQETTNWSTGKVTKNLSQSDLALAVCLSIFITFLVAFILGVLARPCINNLWRRVTKKKAPPATNTATSVQQRHYDNQAFSNAEEPEEIEPHRERRVTFSSVEFTEESNVQYYDTVASGDHESIRSNEVFEYQAAEVELHKHPEEKQRDDSISVDLAVERLRNMEFEHIPDPDELEERRSLSSSSDSSQNASEADQTTRDHTLPKSLHLVEDSLQTRADLSIATETEIPKTSMKGDLENMPTNDSSKTSLEVNPELQSRWAAMNLGISRFRKHLEITSHGTEPSDLTSPLPSNSPFSSSSESGSGKTQRLNKRVVDVKEIRHRGLPPVLENFQVNVSPTLKDPNDKLTFSHVVQQRINSNYSLRNTKDLTTSSNQSSHSSSSSDSEDKTKDHSETDLSRGVPRIKRRLNIKAPSPELSNSPPLLSQNENLTKHNAVQSRQASTFLGPTDESLITYKRSIFKSSLPNSSFTSSGSGHTVNYVSNLSQDGSNDRHISLASKTAPNTSFDDIIKRKLRQSRPKTDGDQLGEIKWTGVGHHLPDLSSSKLRGVNVASTSLQQASFAELTSPSNHSASGTTDINMLQLSKKSDTTPTNKFSSLGPDGESSSSSDIFHNLGNSSQITNETLMAPIGDKDRKGLNALKVMSEERRNWEADKNLTPLFDVQDGGIFSHSQSEKDIKVLSQQSQIQSPSASDSKREIDLVLLYGVPRYKRHSIGDSLMEASFPDPVTPQPDD
ncbi:hypothetical protein ATANTOWER_004668 [Ataeniobius toweri]|uniref:Immunoglobulin domain-containing protein n=1 Tax=Ataeniobius toweri TaxID=208326 RepID=A0ABU7BJ68_9TELE|nr:hypothetical protein [Ataeniobius toweri]